MYDYLISKRLFDEHSGKITKKYKNFYSIIKYRAFLDLYDLRI